jgi:hypothetical protein
MGSSMLLCNVVEVCMDVDVGVDVGADVEACKCNATTAMAMGTCRVHAPKLGEQLDGVRGRSIVMGATTTTT